MKRNQRLTLPALGSVYPFEIDGVTTLRTVESVDLGRGIMVLTSEEHPPRPTFINNVVEFVRPNDVVAWLPEMRKAYAMDDEGRAALIAEANPPRTVEEDLAWVDSLEAKDCAGRDAHGLSCGGDDCPECYPLGSLECTVLNNAEEYAAAFGGDLSRDIYATIGDPVPPLVWPRQECEQSPTRSEVESLKVSDLAIGARVLVVKKADPDDGGAEWIDEMDAMVGRAGVVVGHTGSGNRVVVEIPGETAWAYAPEALALENCCREVPKPVAETPAPVAPRVFKVGDEVWVARKVVTDSKGRDCGWAEAMDRTVGLAGTVTHDDGSYVPLQVDTGRGLPFWYSPEALDLIESAT